jgi:hypothetical protein
VSENRMTPFEEFMKSQYRYPFDCEYSGNVRLWKEIWNKALSISLDKLYDTDEVYAGTAGVYDALESLSREISGLAVRIEDE